MEGQDDDFVNFLIFLTNDSCLKCRARGCAWCNWTGFKQTKKSFKKRPWTQEEDNALIQIIERQSKVNFVAASHEFAFERTTQSIRERYRNYLKKKVR